MVSVNSVKNAVEYVVGSRLISVLDKYKIMMKYSYCVTDREQKAMKTNNSADNIQNRQHEAYGARKVLLTDITYFPFMDGFCTLDPEVYRIGFRGQ